MSFAVMRAVLKPGAERELRARELRATIVVLFVYGVWSIVIFHGGGRSKQLFVFDMQLRHMFSGQKTNSWFSSPWLKSRPIGLMLI